MATLNELEQLLASGRIGRREFMTRVSALGLTTAMSPALLSTPAQAATPKRGGRFRLATADADPADTLDGARSLSAQSIMVQLQLRNCVVEVNHKSEAIPELAESWEPSPDAKQWTFELRRGIEFHNGKTLDAEDVVYSINHHRGEDTTSPEKANLDQVVDLKADGKHTVVFTLAGGNADFPYVLSSYLVNIVPNGADFAMAVGTGGYILDTWEPGITAVTKRNPNYWKAGHANFDEVETIAITDTVSRTNALKSGEIDVMGDPDPKTLHLLDETPGIKVIKVPGRYHRTIPMLTDTAPFENNDARLAMKYAIDREHIVDILLRGNGTVGNDHPLSPDYRYYASELPQRQHDPDKAKFHLKKAGLLDYTFKLHTGSSMPFQGALDMAVLFREHMVEAGFKMEVVREPDDGYWSNTWSQKSMCFCYWPGYATEDLMFSLVYVGGGSWNESHWDHERFNQLLVQARSELDETRRRDMYVEMQRLVRDEGGTIIPVFQDLTMAASDRLGFGELSSLGLSGTSTTIGPPSAGGSNRNSQRRRICAAHSKKNDIGLYRLPLAHSGPLSPRRAGERGG